jgi:hypothetical protein
VHLARETTSVELCEHALGRIEKKENPQPHLHRGDAEQAEGEE